MSRARLVEKGERPGGADHGCAELGRLGWWVGLCALSGVCVCVPKQEVNQVLARLWAKLAVSRRVVVEAAGRTPDCG